MGANMLAEFENIFLIGGIFLIWGIFFNCGQMGANVLVEFENVFFDWGHFFLNWGQLGANYIDDTKWDNLDVMQDKEILVNFWEI